MFHMEDVGRRISELRKQNNMTQMELADRMNISFQAVSSWERGGTMPDIAKLPELALLFGVTIDELLGQRAPLLESVSKGETAEYVGQNPVSAEELAQAAPLLTPKQADEVFERVDPPFSLDEVEDILPFLSKDVLSRLAQKAFDEKKITGRWAMWRRLLIVHC